jgi:hypothetical protein
LHIQDWNEYGLKLLNSQKERQKKRRDRNVTVTVQSRDSNVTVTPTLPNHTLPNRTVPDLTVPHHTTPPPVTAAAAAAATGITNVELKGTKQGWEALIEHEWGIPATRVPKKTVQELTALANKHGTDRVLYAVSEARSHGAHHIGYVRAILDPRYRMAEIEREIEKANQIRTGQGKSI